MSSLRNKIGAFYGRGNNNTAATGVYGGQQGIYGGQQGIYGGQQVYNTQAYVAQPVIATNNIVTEQQLSVQQQEFAQQTTTLQPIVQETIRQDRVVEVQPIIHREVDVPVVNHIERHINEPAPMSRAGAIQHGAIVEERVHNRVINEIQPVIHREVAVPQVEQVQQHFVERVVATPQHTREVIYEQIPAQMGQQFIQQGYGQQQFLQPGLVSRTALMSTPAYSQGYYNTGFGQRTIVNNALPLNQVGYQQGAGFGTGFQQGGFIQQQPGFGTGFQQGGFIGGQQPLLSNQTQYGQQATLRGQNPPGLAVPIQTMGVPTVGVPATAPFVSGI